MKNIQTSENKIDLKKIDWNNLNMEDFSKLSESLNTDIKNNKKIEREKNSKKLIVIEINSLKYEITYSDYTRYKTLKSQKSKDNFLSKIEEKQTPIAEL